MRTRIKKAHTIEPYHHHAVMRAITPRTIIVTDIMKRVFHAIYIYTHTYIKTKIYFKVKKV